MNRFALLAILALVASCGSTAICSPSSCPTGCCTASGFCDPGTEAIACGTTGITCLNCATNNQVCSNQICVASSTGGGAGGGTGGGTGGGAGSTLTAEQQEWVTAHNAARASALPAPSPALATVTWSATAAAQAVDWASRCDFNHRDPNTLGENLFAATNSRTPTAVVTSWANEKNDYTYATNTCALGKQCGHYTQVVWRSSVGIGCATQQCTTGSPFGGGTWFLTVCNYAPAGNFNGQRPY
jgi:uncharacterized protein YkwD